MSTAAAATSPARGALSADATVRLAQQALADAVAELDRVKSKEAEASAATMRALNRDVHDMSAREAFASQQFAAREMLQRANANVATATELLAQAERAAIQSAQADVDPIFKRLESDIGAVAAKARTHIKALVALANERDRLEREAAVAVERRLSVDDPLRHRSDLRVGNTARSLSTRLRDDLGFQLLQRVIELLGGR